MGSNPAAPTKSGALRVFRLLRPDRALIEQTLAVRRVQWTIFAANSPALAVLDALPGGPFMQTGRCGPCETAPASSRPTLLCVGRCGGGRMGKSLSSPGQGPAWAGPPRPSSRGTAATWRCSRATATGWNTQPRSYASSVCARCRSRPTSPTPKRSSARRSRSNGSSDRSTSGSTSPWPPCSRRSRSSGRRRSSAAPRSPISAKCTASWRRSGACAPATAASSSASGPRWPTAASRCNRSTAARSSRSAASSTACGARFCTTSST